MIKKIFSAVLAAVLTVTVAACAAPNGPFTKADTKKNVAVIVYTNDTHTFINNKVKQEDGTETRGMSFANVAALKKELLAQGETVILADAGDHVQGSAYGAFDEGRAIINIMNLVGYDVATLGNHEFDYGLLRTFSFIAKSAFPYVSSNFYDMYDGDLALRPYYVFTTAQGKRIAFVGISTPETLGKTSPTYFYDENGNLRYKFYGIGDEKELYACVQAAVDEARANGADYVIALGHMGIDICSKPFRSTDVIANTRGIDAFIDGHSHHVVEHDYVEDLEGKKVLLTQTGTGFENIGKMTIASDGTITTELISDYEKRDEYINDAETRWIDRVEGQLGIKIADLTMDLKVNDPETGERLVRRQETSAGDFCADAIYYYAGVKRGIDVDIAIVNGGGVRAEIEKGDFSCLEAKTLHPFGNALCAVKVSGQQVLDMLEWGARKVGFSDPQDQYAGECGGFLQISGLTYAIHSEIPPTVVIDEKEDGSWAASPTGEYRVTDVQIYDKEAGKYVPLDLQKTYTLAGQSYLLRNGGDGYTMLRDSELVEEGMAEDYMALADFAGAFDRAGKEYPQIASQTSPLQKYPGFLIDYENPYGSGRITIVK